VYRCNIIKTLMDLLGHFFGEVMKQGASKASALRQVMPHLGLTLSHVVSFGDGNNDAEMIEAAAVGVAVANAQPRAKAVADIVSQYSNNDSAVARELTTLVQAGRFGELAAAQATFTLPTDGS
jgi:hydroxymethylpyrimidine pyrophosphatase-like HAD family hydrolase